MAGTKQSPVVQYVIPALILALAGVAAAIINGYFSQEPIRATETAEARLTFSALTRSATPTPPLTQVVPFISSSPTTFIGTSALPAITRFPTSIPRAINVAPASSSTPILMPTNTPRIYAARLKKFLPYGNPTKNACFVTVIIEPRNSGITNVAVEVYYANFPNALAKKIGLKYQDDSVDTSADYYSADFGLPPGNYSLKVDWVDPLLGFVGNVPTVGPDVSTEALVSVDGLGYCRRLN